MTRSPSQPKRHEPARKRPEVAAGGRGDEAHADDTDAAPLSPHAPRGGGRPAAARVDRAPAHSPPLVARAEEPAREPRPEPPEVEIATHAIPDDAPLDPRLILAREPDSEQAASFRVLRHHLVDTMSPQIVLVASPRASERRTTCALNLAAALAEAGQARVLLVDADRRGPDVARVLRFAPPMCFLSQLEASRAEPIRSLRIARVPKLELDVLASEAAGVSSAALVSGPAVVSGFEALRLLGYDHIVIDGPAVLGSADANTLSEAADAVLMTAQKRRTSVRDLRAVVEQLGGAKLAGTTLFAD